MCIYNRSESRLEKFPFDVRERLASFGAMGAQFRAPLKPLNTIEFCDVR